MNNFIYIFYWVTATISLIQITSASKEEYLQKIEQIKKEPAIQEFIQKHRTSITLYGLLYKWLREFFVHILKTTEGEKTLTHVWTEMEIILKDEKVLNMIRTILSKSEQVLTSEQGPKNTMILAEYFKSALTVPKFLTLLVSAKKVMLYIFTSEHGLKAAIRMKENDRKLEQNPSYTTFEKMIKEQLALIRVPLN